MKWWDKSWNPVVGCTKASPGCANCYAEKLHMQRFSAFLARKKVSGKCYQKPFSTIQLFEERLDIPLRRKIPTTYFVNSMSDLFHPEIPFEFIDKVYNTMLCSHWHTFLTLTKRPERMIEYYKTKPHVVIEAGNVWLGVTVCNQAEADKNIPLLLQTPAAHRFLSIEPMLGEIDLTTTKMKTGPVYSCVNITKELDQVILGGETGPNARPTHPDWARKVRDDCKAAGVPFFMKQMTSRKPIPEDLQTRELAWRLSK